MKSLVCLLVLSATLLPSVAAPVANRDLAVSSRGQDSLTAPDGLNIALKPQEIITSLSRREAFNSSAATEKDYGFGPLKYFTWRLQMQALEIHSICQASFHSRHFPDFDDQEYLVSNMSAVVSLLQATDLSNVARNYEDYHQEWRKPELRKLLVQNVELVGGMVTHIVRLNPFNEVLDPRCRQMLEAMFITLRPLWPLIDGSIRNACIRLDQWLHEFPGWHDISNVLDEMLEDLNLSA